MRGTATALVLSVAAGVAGCGGGPSPRPAPPGLIVGLVAATELAGLGREQDVAARTGVRWLREDVEWAKVERRPGRFSFGATDALVVSSAHRHLRLLPLLYTTPRWQARRPLTLPPHDAPWARFVARVVARYGPGGEFWKAHRDLDARLAPRVFELWNEPYYPRFSAGGADPARYARVVRAAVRAGRAANPQARFLVQAETQYGAKDGTVRNWIDDMFAAVPDLGRYIDALAVHPYTPASPASSAPDRRYQFARIDDMEAALRRLGAGPRPLWITEIGWSTCRLRPDCVSEPHQGRYLADLFGQLAGRYRRIVRAVFVYHLSSFPNGVDDPQASFGMLRVDGSRKPAWYVLRRATRAAAR